MASPWKFLSRLVSPRREHKQEEDTVDDTKPDVLALASPTGAPAEENLSSADQPAGVEPSDRDPAEPASAEPAPADEAESQTHDTAGGADVAAVAGSASGDTRTAITAAHDAVELEPNVEGTARRQRSRAKKAEKAVVVAPVSPGVQSASDETISLDEEIRMLKGQLASKLQTQNAQLKKMLERFER